MSTADQVDELRARRTARAAERAALEERRQVGLKARHAAKLAHLATRERNAEENSPQSPEPDAA